MERKKETLEDFLADAEYYLYKVDDERLERFRKEVLEFCVKNHLDEKFLTLVKDNTMWKELAAQKTVSFFVDVPRHRDIFSKTEDFLGISIAAFEGNKVPVIKISSPVNFLC